MKKKYYIKKCQLEEALGSFDDHEPCKDYYFSCRNCQTTLLIQLLKEEIETINWILDDNKQDKNGKQGREGANAKAKVE